MTETIERFEKLLSQNPNNGLARFSLAKALFDSNRFPEAKAHFERALAQKPEWMMAQILLGKCELALGQKQQARSAFQRGLELAIEQHHEGPQAELETILQELDR